MGQIATVAATQLPEGAKIVKSKQASPVMITRIRTVGKDQQTVELQLEQMFEPPINGQSGVLSLTMAGHTAFNTGLRKRLTWQNFSVIQAVKFGIIRSWEEVAESKVEINGREFLGTILCNKELVLKYADGSIMPCKLVEVDTFTGRTWVDSTTGRPMTQQPKKAGQDGDMLTYNGKPIYRNTGLSFVGAEDKLTGREWDQDVVILHNNLVVGSTVRAAMGKAGIAVPKFPGTPEGSRADGSTSNPDLQNKEIGNTPNLREGAPEHNRSNPNEQTQQVAEKTKAEEEREAGQREIVQHQ